MRRGELASDARLPLRYNRESKPCNEYSLVQHHIAHLDRERCLPYDDRYDWCLSGERSETSIDDSFSKVPSILVQIGDSLRMVLDKSNRRA